jgi:fermentation-respiration switch protein FrsA (DUF1100 family)
MRRKRFECAGGSPAFLGADEGFRVPGKGATVDSGGRNRIVDGMPLLFRLTGGLLLALALATRAEETAPVQPAASKLFDYDRAAPLDVRELAVETQQGARVRDITFEGGRGPVAAYLVTPANGGEALAGVLYVHWLGNPATTNRTEFLSEAIALASQGVVSLLVNTMWAKPTWYRDRIPENDYDEAITQIVELRRALDVLLAEPGVDPKRIAYVGHDFGAMYGAVMGAVDRRPTSYVLMAGTPHFVDWFLFARQPKDPASYRAKLAPLDPINFVSQLAPAPVFFQFASNDEYVSADAALKFYAAAKPSKQTATYEAGHDLQKPEAAADRITWLVRMLAPKQ